MEDIEIIIRKAEINDAAEMAEIFKNDLREPDCTEALVWQSAFLMLLRFIKEL